MRAERVVSNGGVGPVRRTRGLRARSHRGAALKRRCPERPGDAHGFGLHPRVRGTRTPPATQVLQMPAPRTSTSGHQASIASPVLDHLDEASLALLSADGFGPCAVVETSAGHFQACLKHATVFPTFAGTFAAQTLASLRRRPECS